MSTDNPNRGDGQQQPPRMLRRPNPETELKFCNGSPGSATNMASGQDFPKGRAILGSHMNMGNRGPADPVSVMPTYPQQQQLLHMNRRPPPGMHAAGLSALSVNAPSFVPTFHQQNFHPGFKGSSLSVNAPEFFPRLAAPPPPPPVCPPYPPPPISMPPLAVPQYNMPMTPAEMQQYDAEQRLYEEFQRLVSIRPPHLSASPSVSGSGAVELIKNTIYHLTTNPGQINTYMLSVVAKLQKEIPDEDTMNKIVEILIEQGIMEPNFRYTGAKMCQFLSKHLNVEIKQRTFRHFFLQRFQQEYVKKDTLILNPDDHIRICGLTLFLGELFLNMEIDKPNGISEKFGALRKALKDLLITLLSHVTDATIKCVCQLLKLAGSTIQDTEYLNVDQGSSYEEVFWKLQQISQLPNLGQTPRLLISSVLSLREANWGRKESIPSEPSPDISGGQWDGTNQLCLNEPVFYDEQGQPITREQAGFYVDETEDEFVEYNFDGGDTEYPPWASADDGLYDPYAYDISSNVYGAEGDMDDEMEAAYEEFLKSQGQS